MAGPRRSATNGARHQRARARVRWPTSLRPERHQLVAASEIGRRARVLEVTYLSGTLSKSGVLLLVAVVVAACSASAVPAEAGSCGDLVDIAVRAVEQARDDAINTTQEDFDLLSSQASPILRELNETHDAVEQRSQTLGCNEESSDEYTQRVLELAPLSGGGMRILEYAFFPPFQAAQLGDG